MLKKVRFEKKSAFWIVGKRKQLIIAAVSFEI
jgi:hypothetical protein